MAMLALARPLGRRSWTAARRAYIRGGASTDHGATLLGLPSAGSQARWSPATNSIPRLHRTSNMQTDGRLLPAATERLTADNNAGAMVFPVSSIPLDLPRSFMAPASLTTLAGRLAPGPWGQVAALHSSAKPSTTGGQATASRITVAQTVKDLQEWVAAGGSGAAGSSSSIGDGKQWTREGVESLLGRLGNPASHAPISLLLDAFEAARAGGLVFSSGWTLVVRGLAARGEIGLAWEHLKIGLGSGALTEAGGAPDLAKSTSHVLQAIKDQNKWSLSRAAATPVPSGPLGGKKEPPSVLAVVQGVRSASRAALGEGTYAQALGLGAKQGDVATVQQLLQMMREDGHSVELNHLNQRVLATAIGDGMDAALALVEEMRASGMEPDLATVTAALSSCRTDEQVARALALLDKLEAEGTSFGARTYAALLKGIQAARNPDAAWRVYTHLEASQRPHGRATSQNESQNQNQKGSKDKVTSLPSTSSSSSPSPSPGKRQALSDISVYRPLVLTLADAGRGPWLGDALAAMWRHGVRPDGIVYRSMLRSLTIPDCRAAVTHAMSALRSSLHNNPIPAAGERLLRQKEAILVSANRPTRSSANRHGGGGVVMTDASSRTGGAGGEGKAAGVLAAAPMGSLAHPLGQLALEMALEMPLHTYPSVNVTGAVLDAVVDVCLSVGHERQHFPTGVPSPLDAGVISAGVASPLDAAERHSGALAAAASILPLMSSPDKPYYWTATRNRVATALLHAAAAGYGGWTTAKLAWVTLANLRRLGPLAATPATLGAAMEANVAIGLRRDGTGLVGGAGAEDAAVAGLAAALLWEPLQARLAAVTGESIGGGGEDDGVSGDSGSHDGRPRAADWAALVSAYALVGDVAKAEEVLASARAAATSSSEQPTSARAGAASSGTHQASVAQAGIEFMAAGSSPPSPLGMAPVISAAAARMYAREGRVDEAMRWLDALLSDQENDGEAAVDTNVEPSADSSASHSSAASSNRDGQAFALQACAGVLDGFAAWVDELADHRHGYPARHRGLSAQQPALSTAKGGSGGAESTGEVGGSIGGAFRGEGDAGDRPAQDKGQLTFSLGNSAVDAARKGVRARVRRPRDPAREAEVARDVARGAWGVIDRLLGARKGSAPTEACYATAVTSCQLLGRRWRPAIQGAGEREDEPVKGGENDGFVSGRDNTVEAHKALNGSADPAVATGTAKAAAAEDEEDRALLARAMGVEGEMRAAGIVPGPLTYAALAKVHAAQAIHALGVASGAGSHSDGTPPGVVRSGAGGSNGPLDGADRAGLYHRLMAQLVTDAGSSEAAGAALALRGHDTRAGALLQTRHSVHAAVAGALLARGDIPALVAHLQGVLDMAGLRGKGHGEETWRGAPGVDFPLVLLPLVRSACRRAGRRLDAEFAKQLDGLVVR